MNDINEKQRLKIITEFYDIHQHWSKNQIESCFAEMNIARSTVYNILSNYEERGNCDRQSGSGRSAVKLTVPKRKKNTL